MLAFARSRYCRRQAYRPFLRRLNVRYRMNFDYLFASPSLLAGFGRVFDPFGLPEPYNLSRSPQEADKRAMAVDWAMVGNDLAEAIAEYGSNPHQMLLFRYGPHADR